MEWPSRGDLGHDEMILGLREVLVAKAAISSCFAEEGIYYPRIDYCTSKVYPVFLSLIVIQSGREKNGLR